MRSPLLLIIAATIALSGCSMLDPYVVETGPVNAEATPSTPAEEPEPSPTSTVGGARGLIIDSGPREHAMGEATTNDDGTVSYTAVEGDLTGVICDRFDRYPWQAVVVKDGKEMNGQRTCGAMLFAGDVLKLTDVPGTPSQINLELTEK